MKITDCIVFLMLILVPAYSTILMRHTFEEYEGDTPQECGWGVITNSNGVVVLEEESGDLYQTQSHGAYSIRVYDSDNNSYANVYKTVSNTTSEYMIEFYICICDTHATIDSFPFCQLWNVALPETLYPDLQYKTDVAMYLTTVATNPPNGDVYEIYLKDSNGFQYCVDTLEQTDRWYKIQIYRHDNIVDFYLDGDSVATFSPMNSNYVSNKVVLGTTQADSLADGEVFYDDVIISTPPSGEHPRLLFSEDDLEMLRDRKTDNDPGNLGVSYATMWNRLQTWADSYLARDTVGFLWPNESGHDTLHYPFHQLPYHMQDTTRCYWEDPMRQIDHWLNILSFVGLTEEDQDYVDRAKGILHSLVNWHSFVNQSDRTGGPRYAKLCTGLTTHNIALAYDWLYDYLTPYERLNIQNTLLSLGIGQIYLQGLYWNEDPASNEPTNYANGRIVIFGGGLGIACLALDSAQVAGESLLAYNKIDSLLCHLPDAVGPDGGFNEGCSYGGFAVDYALAYLDADDILSNYVETSFIENYPKWRIQCMLPGAEQ